MKITEQQIIETLRGVPYPGFSRDIVSFGIVEKIRIDGSRVQIVLRLDDAKPNVADAVRERTREVVEALEGVDQVRFANTGSGGSPSLKVVQPHSRKPSAAQAGSVAPNLLPQVRHTIAVASGKGGVGKSTVAVNLAIALARAGVRVGLLDADIYGPSIPIMMGARDERPQLDPDLNKLIPLEKHGVRFMSLGFLVDPDTAVIWRGPMVMKALEQLLRDVLWGTLDVLVVDMPPGTGDAQLTLSQRIQLAGAVIVTTPQDVALADAIKGVAMFRKVEVPLLGLIENMSYFHCPKCSERSEIFGHGGGRTQAEKLGVPFLGEVPLDGAIRAAGDDGTPLATDHAVTKAFAGIATRILDTLKVESTSDAGIFDRFKKIWSGEPPR